jgi:hypothetical protein
MTVVSQPLAHLRICGRTDAPGQTGSAQLRLTQMHSDGRSDLVKKMGRKKMRRIRRSAGGAKCKWQREASDLRFISADLVQVWRGSIGVSGCGCNVVRGFELFKFCSNLGDVAPAGPATDAAANDDQNSTVRLPAAARSCTAESF